MSDPTTDFFEDLGRRGHEPLLETAKGTVRVDLANGKETQRWHVAIDKGDLKVSHRNTAADCALRTDRKTFDDLATGDANAMATVLRGAMAVEGDLSLMLQLQRLFPAPPAGMHEGRRS